MHKKQELSLLYITAQYVADVQAGRQPRLSDYLARYPRYADAIADFVAYYHAVEEVRPSGELASAGTMTTLLATATGQRLTLSQIAAELNLSIDIVLLLEQRAIVPATIPHVLCEQIAILLQQPSAMVQEYLCSLGQHQPGSAMQKRKQQRKVAEEGADYPVPHVMDKLSFRAMVETSLQLSAEQKSHWRTILDAEGS
jgi:hypothetical protein